MLGIGKMYAGSYDAWLESAFYQSKDVGVWLE